MNDRSASLPPEPPSHGSTWNAVEVEFLDKSVRLYLGEIEAILSVFRELEKAPARVELPFWRQEFESAGDLADMLTSKGYRSVPDVSLSPALGDQSRGLTVQLKQPVHIAYFPPDDRAIELAMLRIRDILRGCRVRNGGLSLGATTLGTAIVRQFVLLSAIVTISIVATVSANSVGTGSTIFPGLLAVLIGLFAVFAFAIRKIFFARNPSPLAQLVLRQREEPLRRRLRDPLVANGISYLLGIASAIVVKYLVQLVQRISK